MKSVRNYTIVVKMACSCLETIAKKYHNTHIADHISILFFSITMWTKFVLTSSIITLINIKIKPAHDKTYKMACASSGDSDQPGHPPSLIRVFAVRMKQAWDLATHWAHSEDADQTGRMPRLNWSLRWVHMPFVGFVVWWFDHLSIVLLPITIWMKCVRILPR